MGIVTPSVKANPVVAGVWNDIIPSKHLPKLTAALASGSAKVGIMGDSTSTENANEVASSEYMWPDLMERIWSDNPGKTFTFYNRAVPGQRWTDAQGVATSNWPSWYTPTTANWLGLIQPLGLDTLFLNFGMNPDPTPIDLAAFHAVLTAIQAWAKVPDIVFITNKQPVLSATVPLNGYTISQPARHVTAGFLRSYAKAKGFGLIDFNRQHRIARDGVDPWDQHLVIAATGVAGLKLPVALATSDGDFDLRLTFPGQAATLWTNLTNLTFTLGNRSDNVLILGKDGGTGNLTMQVYEGTGQSFAGFVVGGVPASGTGDTTVEVLMKRGHLTFLYNGIQIYSQLVPVMGGQFLPTVAGIGPSVASVTVTVNSGSVGVSRKYTPTLTDADAYSSAGNMGGNDINHMNSLGISAVEQPVLQALQFG